MKDPGVRNLIARRLVLAFLGLGHVREVFKLSGLGGKYPQQQRSSISEACSSATFCAKRGDDSEQIRMTALSPMSGS